MRKWKEHTKIRISLFAICANDQSIILIILLQEPFRVIVTIDVDLCKSIVDSLLLVTGGQGGFKKRQEQLQAIPRLHFSNKLINWNRSRVDGLEKIFNNHLITIDVKKATNDSWGSGWINALNIYLDRLELLVLV